MISKYICSFLFLALSFTASAQEEGKSAKQIRKERQNARIEQLIRQEEEGVIAYRKHFAAGVKLTTDGYGGFIEVGRATSVKRSHLFQLEITERKHRKEEKQYNFFTGAGPYIYGKINYFYPVKLGFQEQLLLANKGNKNGVTISANAGGGFIAGLLRPYLLGYDSLGTQIFRGYADDSTRFVDEDPVTGPDLGTGFNRLKVTPGVYLKGGLRFDYGKYNETISALEVGVMAEYYTKRIEQMVGSNYYKFFFSGYIALIIGKRK